MVVAAGNLISNLYVGTNQDPFELRDLTQVSLDSPSDHIINPNYLISPDKQLVVFFAGQSHDNLKMQVTAANGIGLPQRIVPESGPQNTWLLFAIK